MCLAIFILISRSGWLLIHFAGCPPGSQGGRPRQASGSGISADRQGELGDGRRQRAATAVSPVSTWPLHHLPETKSLTENTREKKKGRNCHISFHYPATPPTHTHTHTHTHTTERLEMPAFFLHSRCKMQPICVYIFYLPGN